MVRGLHHDAQLLQRAHRLLAQVVAQVGRQHVEVAALVDDLGLLGCLEVEVLELGPHVEVEPQVGGALELPSQDPAGVALVGLELAVQDVAEDEGRALLVLRPGQHTQGLPGGHRDDVRLLDLSVPGDRRAVEGGAVLHDAVQLGLGDLDHLEAAQDVGEPQLDVTHVVVRDLLADPGLELIVHSLPLGRGFASRALQGAISDQGFTTPAVNEQYGGGRGPV